MSGGGALFRAFLVLAALTTGVTLAGCVDCAGGPPVTARDVSPQADASGGIGTYGLTVRVTAEPGGPPVENAGVVVYWDRDDADGEGGTLIVEDGDERVIIADPGQSFGTPQPRKTIRLATDANGEATARVPANRVVGVVAAKAGWTEEWIPALATGDRLTGDTVTVPLYRAQLNATIEDAWPYGAASSGFATNSNYEWHPQALPFGDDDETRRGYAKRVSEITVRVTWENGLQGGGDLAVGIGHARDEPAFVHDANDEAAPGPHTEEVRLTADQLADAGILAAPEIFVGPATASGFVGLTELPYKVEVDARFDPAIAQQALCGADTDTGGEFPGASVPGAGLLAGLVALGGGGLLLSRRSRS